MKEVNRRYCVLMEPKRLWGTRRRSRRCRKASREKLEDKNHTRLRVRNLIRIDTKIK